MGWPLVDEDQEAVEIGKEEVSRAPDLVSRTRKDRWWLR